MVTVWRGKRTEIIWSSKEREHIPKELKRFEHKEKRSHQNRTECTLRVPIAHCEY